MSVVVLARLMSVTVSMIVSVSVIVAMGAASMRVVMKDIHDYEVAKQSKDTGC